MKAVLTLLMNALLQLVRGGGGQSLASRMLGVLLLSSGVFLMVILYKLMFRFSSAVMEAPIIGPVLARRILDLGLWALIFLTMTSALTQALGLLLMAEDLVLLRISPMARRILLAARLVLIYGASCWAAVALTIPLLGPSASLMGGGFEGWAQATLIVATILAIPVMVGTAAGLVLGWFLPSGRVKEAVTVMGSLFLGVGIVVIRILAPEKIMKPPEGQDPLLYLETFSSALDPLPGLVWGNAIWASLQGERTWSESFIICLMTIAAVIPLFFLLEFLWRLSLEKGPGGPRSHKASLLSKLLSRRGSLQSMYLKNAFLFLRDPSQAGQLLLFVLLCLLYVLNLKALPQDLRGPMVGLLGFLNIGFAGLLASAFLARFFYPALSGEGMGIWVVMASPTRLRRYIFVRTAWAVICTWVLLVVIHVSVGATLGRLPILEKALALAIPCQALGLSFLSIGFGILSARFELNPASRLLSTVPGFAYLLFELVFVSLVLGVLAVPVWEEIRWAPLRIGAKVAPWGLSGALLALLVLGTGLFWWYSLSRLHKLGQKVA